MPQKIFSVILFLMLITSFLPAVPAGASVKPKIFIVHSYEQNHICGQPQHQGILNALREGGFSENDIELQVYYMDTKKTNTTPDMIKEQGKIALQKIQDFKSDLVLVLDDNAIRQIMLPLAGSDVPVIFSGMNNQPEAYNEIKKCIKSVQHPGHNVTGVYEKLHLAKSISVLRATLPNLKKIIGITDYSPTGSAITKQFQKELAEENPGIDFDIKRVKNFNEYKKLIYKLNSDPLVGAIYPAALSLKTDSGETYTAGQIFRWTIKHCTKPGMALNYYFSKLGIFGGAAVNFESMGHQAGKIAAIVLKGADPGEIPIQEARRYAIVFNLERANQLNIKIPFEILGAADHVYKEIILK